MAVMVRGPEAVREAEAMVVVELRWREEGGGGLASLDHAALGGCSLR